MTRPNRHARLVSRPALALLSGKFVSLVRRRCTAKDDVFHLDSVFPVRGQPDNDREFRHPRIRADKAARRDPAKVRREILDAPIMRQPDKRTLDEWERLPPLADIIDAVNRFTCHYFQLGFIPKEQFPQNLQSNSRNMSVFLIVSILSISARLTPSLVARYGTGLKAAEYFMESASRLAHGELYEEPTLERCQAFYLLSIAQQGSGLRNHSYVGCLREPLGSLR